MVRNVVDCLAPEGVIDLGGFNEEDKTGILSYCGFDDRESERFYVKVGVRDVDDNVVEFSQGDSGAMWVLDVFKSVDSVSEEMKRYDPGYSKEVYDVIVVGDEGSDYGKIEVEVLVSDG